MSYYDPNGEEAARLLGTVDSEPETGVAAAESAAFTMAANQLLTLDEVLNK